MNPLQNRTYLHDRHRLSHQQIDNWLGENRCGEFKEEKIKRLDHIRNFLLITDKLRQNNIAFVCIKGPLLSLRLYDDPTVRMSADIDLLVDKKDIDTAIKVLLTERFEFAHGSQWPQEEHRQKLIMKDAHHLEFFNRQQGFCVEIHWVLTEQLAVPMKKVQKVVSENLTAVFFANRQFTVLDKEFELLYLLIHGSRHAWIRLKWLEDINQYTRIKIDENKFSGLVELLKAERIVCQTNYLLKKYFNSNLPINYNKHIPQKLIVYADNAINSNQSAVNFFSNVEILKNKVYQWFIYSSLYYKISFLPGLFVRPVDVANRNFSHKILYVLYRPYSFIRRRILHV